MRKPANGYRFPETTFRDLDRQRLILYGEDENRIVKIKKYLQEYEDTLRSVIVLDGRLGSYDLKRVFNTDKSIFSNPKPVDLLKSFISYSTSAHDIVLDLFGGSGTTAQAVLDLNELNKAKKRSFILVQLPEPVNSETIEGKNALELGLKTISEIGKERVRRVINKLESGQVKELFENETMEPDRGLSSLQAKQQQLQNLGSGRRAKR